MFGFVCRKIGLFPALLHREKVFCQFTASYAAFYLVLLKRRKTLSFVTQSSNQLKFAANKPKGVFDKLERQKRISCRKKW